MTNLNNTYIKNEKGELRDLYIAECVKQGLSTASDRPISLVEGDYIENDNGVIYSSNKERLGRLSKELTLADLRKQQPTVFDAVAWFEGCLINHTRGDAQIFYYDGGYNIGGNGVLVSTVSKCNQCVDDLAMWANKPKGAHAPYTAYNYTNHKLNNPVAPIETQLSSAVTTLKAMGYTWNGGEQWKPPLGDAPEYIKPRVKIDYVKVNPNKEGDAYWECARDFANGVELFIDELGARAVIDNDELLFTYKCNKLWRKVEAELTWQDEVLEVVNSKVADFEAPYIEFKDDEVIIDGRLNIEVFKSICKLVTSLT